MSPLSSLVLLLVAFKACMTSAQILQLGKCDPDIQAMSNFKAESYLGKWYENAKYITIFQLGGKCVTATYSLNSTDGSVNVLNRQIDSRTNQEVSIEGIAKFENDDNTVSKLTVKFPSLPVSVDAPYWVLSTDYDRYAVVYSCSDALVAQGKFLWILTRERNPSQEVVDKAYAEAESFDLNTKILIKTDQTGCDVLVNDDEV